MMKNINRKIAAIVLAITTVTTTVMMPASATWSSTPFTTSTTYTYQDYQKQMAETADWPTLTSYANTNYGARFKNYTKTPYQYNSLTKQEKTLYKNIMKYINADKTEIKIAEGVTNEQLQNVMDVIAKYGCEVTLEYYEKTRTLEVADYAPTALFVEIAEEIEAKFPKKASDYDKIKVIHDEICRRYKYGNVERGKLKIASETLLCGGYASLFKEFCKYFNIECYITGSVSGNHNWNKVVLAGEWYNVDVCWDDTSKIRYNYFLISDTTVQKIDKSGTHSLKNQKQTLPESTKSYSK